MNTMNPDELVAKLEKAKRELRVLYEVSTAIQSSLDLEHTLYAILTGVTSHLGLGYNRAILYLVDRESEYLVPSMAIGPKSGEHAERIWNYIEETDAHIDKLIEEQNISKNLSNSDLWQHVKDKKFSLLDTEDQILTKAYKQGEPMHLHYEAIMQLKGDPLFEAFHSEDLIIMPVRAKGAVKGLIVADNVYTKKSIDFEDLKIFGMICDQAGLAIENSKFYEFMKYRSQTDSLTDLWNHGFFQARLQAEVDMMEILDQELALIAIDIDHFKVINDSYGHQKGDEILRRIAVLLRSVSREQDYVCRYGGEEFSVILPNTDSAEAQAIAERMRLGVESLEFQDKNNKPIHVTISAGVAVFPHTAEFKDDLILQADEALYASKREGRNQTTIYKA